MINMEIEDELMNIIFSKFGHEVFTPGFERILPLFNKYKKLVNQRNVKIITIGGTNGKGQTAHTLAALLNKEGKNIALWTSPHILSITERFCFSKDQKVLAVSHEELKKVVLENLKTLEIEHDGLKVSFYEFLFLCFWRLVEARNDLDFIILEVGLGGRLDAVNLFDAEISSIVSISRDHQTILGGRYDQILLEKLPISRANKTLVTSFKLQYLNNLTSKYCNAKSVKWISLPNNSTNSYFEQNQIMAKAICNIALEKPLSFLSPEDRRFIQNLDHYKGRREVMTFNGNSLIFIGAHNTDGIRHLVESLKMDLKNLNIDELLISFSKRPFEELKTMYGSLNEHFKTDKKITITSFNHVKACDESELLRLETVYKGNFNFVKDWKNYLSSQSDKKILICGSYYFIGEIQRFITSDIK